MAALAPAPQGDPDAPKGSLDRLNHARLCALFSANNLHKAPHDFKCWWEELCEKYPDPKKPTRTIDGWRMLVDAQGVPFKSLAAFCEHRQPWGLGKPLETVRRYIAALKAPKVSVGGHDLEIDAARRLSRSGAVDKRLVRDRDETGAFIQSHNDCEIGNDAGNPREDQQLRAINRAPEPLPTLFDADLVSKTVAVAASGADTSVGAAAEAVIRERGAPTNDTEKRETRRLVDAAVRETAGVTKPTHTLATITTIFRAWHASASPTDRDAFADVVQAAQRNPQ
jgi:hypothetical protein